MLKHTYTTCFILPDVQEKENNEIKHKNYGLPHSFEFYFFLYNINFSTEGTYAVKKLPLGKKLHVIISKALTAFKLGLNDNYI